MAKLPYMQFYPADYLRDTRCLSMASRGAWVDILCTLWNAKKRGQKSLSLEGWAGELGKPASEVSLYLLDLESHEIGKFIHEKDEKITIICRRMVREDRTRRFALKRLHKHRDASVKRSCNADETLVQRPIYQKSEVRSQKSESEEEKKEETLSSSIRDLMGEARVVLSFLNEKTGRNYRPVKSTLDLIAGRLRGESKETAVDVQTCKSMIAKKARDWLPKPEMSPYLRPKTLFSKTNFEQYLGELLCVVPNATATSTPMLVPAPAAGGHLRSLS